MGGAPFRLLLHRRIFREFLRFSTHGNQEGRRIIVIYRMAYISWWVRDTRQGSLGYLYEFAIRFSGNGQAGRR